MSRDYMAKRVAKLKGISYARALHLLRPAGADEWEPTQDDLLNEAIQAACEELTGRRAGTQGFDFGEIGKPDFWVEDVTIDLAEPDLDSVVTDGSGGSDEWLYVSVRFSFVGYVPKSDVHNCSAKVVEFDWNDHYSRVAFTSDQAWTLRWNCHIIPLEPYVQPELTFDCVLEPAIELPFSG
ncbi:hypothetical protein [Actinoplanes sp. DH11]|uniref:hypothetical protein n=1 Tax=Actinoplanes sp. DH11 TaxID=2857011 RepID=UPI001E3980AB|nr:hypothetical protein [Actinoplanes sp. DH11]